MKQQKMKQQKLKTGGFGVRQVVLIGMFGALAAVLMLFEIPLPFLAPSFYGLDVSEIPVMIGTFSMGPVAGVVIELVKILVKLLLKPTSTGGVGELANFVIGCAMVLPAGWIYQMKKTKKSAIISMITGTVCMAIVGALVNAWVMLPFYSHFMPLETILEAGAAINPAISNIWTFVLICVVPFNLLKGGIVSLITILVYKRISVMIHMKV